MAQDQGRQDSSSEQDRAPHTDQDSRQPAAEQPAVEQPAVEQPVAAPLFTDPTQYGDAAAFGEDATTLMPAVPSEFPPPPGPVRPSPEQEAATSRSNRKLVWVLAGGVVLAGIMLLSVLGIGSEPAPPIVQLPAANLSTSSELPPTVAPAALPSIAPTTPVTPTTLPPLTTARPAPKPVVRTTPKPRPRPTTSAKATTTTSKTKETEPPTTTKTKDRGRSDNDDKPTSGSRRN